MLGFASLGFFFWLVLRVHPAAFLRDMWMVYNVARDSQGPVLPQILTLVFKLRLNLAALAIAFAAVAWIRRKNRRVLFRCALAMALLVGAELLLGVSNIQLPVAVLIPAEVLILYELALCSDSGADRFDWERSSAVRISLGWILLTVGIFLGIQRVAVDLVCTEHALETRLERGADGYPGQQIDAAPFKALFVPPLLRDGYWSDYPLLLNLGLDLARRHVTKQSRLVAMEYNNPFNIALGLKPAKGDALWWHLGRTFSPRTHPAPDRVFAQADFVIVSRRWFDFLWPTYGDYIEQKYQLLDRNEAWVLFKRSRR
jgi:hypothetical protein